MKIRRLLNWHKLNIVTAIVVVLSLIMGLSIPAMADSTERTIKTNNFEKEAMCMIGKYITYNSGYELVNQKKICRDLESFDRLGIDAQCIEIDKIIDNDIIYKYDFGNDVIGTVELEVAINGNSVLKFREGDNENYLEVTPDFVMYLDGHEVSIYNEEEMARTVTNAGTVSPYSSAESVFRHNPPYSGSASNYTTFIRTYSKTSVNAGTPLVSVGAGVLTDIICIALRASGIVGIYVSALVGLALGVKNTAEEYGTDSAYLSYKVDKYQYVVNNTSTRYYMYTGKYYTKKDYQGSYYNYTFFEKKIMT